MNEKQPRSLIIPPQGGMFKDAMLRVKLILHLIGDRRVSIFLKLLPAAALGYLIWPLDALPAIPIISGLDDAAILWLGTTLFMELCPPEIIREHVHKLSSNLDIIEHESGSGEVVDADSVEEVKDK